MRQGLAGVARFVSIAFLLPCAMILGAPAPAAAQDGWEVNIAPLYFWAASFNGSMSAGMATVPVSLDFKDAVDKLAGAFAFHVDGRKGKFGVESDVYFIRLSTNARYQLPLGLTAQGALSLDTTIVEIGGTYLAAKDFTIIGGVRTYSFSPDITLTGALNTNTFSATKTDVDGFGGFMYRPQVAQKVWLITRADVGAGQSKVTWRAVGGVEYRYKPWGGIAAAYSAYGIDAGSSTATIGLTPIVTTYNVTQYGPAFSLTFHWGR